MTIDEAIKHAEEVSNANERLCKTVRRDMQLSDYGKCAEEHRQLAEWLKDYKRLLEQEPCEDAVSRKTVLNTLNRMDSVLDENRTVETYKELLIACYNDLPPVTPTHTEIVTEFADRCRECGSKYGKALKTAEYKNKMHPIKDGFPKTNSGRYLVQDIDGRIWDAEYDECQDNPEERFGEWAQRFDPSTLGAIDSEWDPYADIVAWCELPELYEEEDQEHESEADKMKEVGKLFAQGIEKGLKSTEEETK